MVHYAARPILKINGVDAPQRLTEDILQISVEESLHLPGMFTLVINNPYFPGVEGYQPWGHESLFEIGKSIKIGFKSSTTEATEFSASEEDIVLEGEITGIETHFTKDSEAPLVIRGYDVSHRLHRGRYNRSFQNITDTDIVRKIAGEAGIPTGKIDNSGSPHDYVFQENQTNMEFLRERAARNGFELFVQDGTLNFRQPKSEASLKLEWLKNIYSFRVRVSSAEQVSAVEVRGWDYKKKRPIVSTANAAKLITETEQGKGENTSSAFNGKPSSPKMVVVDQPVFSAAEADKIAQALFNELGGAFVCADAKADGNPQIRPGKVVKLDDMGKYSGKYYITETRHLFQEGVYATEFSVRGLRGEDLLTTLSPPTHLGPGQHLMVGVVTDNQDPEGLGRVRVWLPSLTPESGPDAHASNWARVVAIGAGNQRGFDCLPEIGDEVLVGFEHGDIHRPYVIGGVWNGQDKTPEKVQDSVNGGKVRLRTFKTRTGHKFQFVEEDKGSSKKGVYIDTIYGHHIHMNDTEKFIEIKTQDGQLVRIDETQKRITIQTQGEIVLTANQKITLKAGPSKIEMDPTNIKMEGMNVSIKGTAQTKVQGAMVSVEGSGVTAIKGGVVKIN